MVHGRGAEATVLEMNDKLYDCEVAGLHSSECTRAAGENEQS